MSLILQVAWVTQASDFITLNWYKLLGVFGGVGGLIAFVTMIGKLLITCVQGHYNKKFNSPIYKEILELKQIVLALIEEIKMLKIVIENSSSSNKEELKEYFKCLIARSQKIKVALYDKMVTGEDDVQGLLDNLDAEIKETNDLIQEPTDEPVELPILPETNTNEQVTETIYTEEQEQISANCEPEIKHKRKKQKLIVER